MSTAPPPEEIAADILHGAEQIALFLYGSASATRQIYRLTSEVPPEYRLPTFRLGSHVLCARKSTIRAWITKQESRSADELVADLTGKTPA